MAFTCSCNCYFHACNPGPTGSSSPGGGQAVVPAVEARSLPGQLTAGVWATKHGVESAFSHGPLLLSTSSVAVDTERDCGQLTFAESEHQAKRRADTPEPFTQVHRRVRGFSQPGPRQSKASSLCKVSQRCFTFNW